MNFLSTVFFGVEPEKFLKGVQAGIDAIQHKNGIFTGDNLITFGRNLSFLQDQRFTESWGRFATTPVEKAIVWRVYVLCWAANSVISRGILGDLVECGCYKGVTAQIIANYVDFSSLKDRTYYLYDLFEHDPSMDHHSMPEHGPNLFNQVVANFSSMSNVKVLKGEVPEVMEQASPEKIAFMHIDLNGPEAEIGALEKLFDRMSPGGILVLDDYGWLAYRAQKVAEDSWLESRGYKVLELPTGQGVVFI